MTPRPQKGTASRDDMRAVMRLAKKMAKAPRRNIKLRGDSLKRLNWLRDHHFKCDDQSMAIDLACLQITGSLEKWREQAMPWFGKVRAILHLHRVPASDRDHFEVVNMFDIDKFSYRVYEDVSKMWVRVERVGEMAKKYADLSRK